MLTNASRHAAWIACFAILTMASSAFAQCPDGCISFGTGGTACGSATSRDSTFNSGPDSYRATYDITLGKISNQLTSNGRSSSVTVTDVFRLVGAPPGPPIQIQARLAVSGAGIRDPYNVYAQSSIGINGPQLSVGRIFWANEPPDEVVINIMASPDEPFTLTMFASCHTLLGTPTWSTRVEGTLSFAFIPAGASIVSCGGYFTDTPVPARKTTWGRLKSLYR
jgi:hypothetical protein